MNSGENLKVPPTHMTATMILFSLHLAAVFLSAHTVRCTDNYDCGDFAIGRGFDSTQGALKESFAFKGCENCENEDAGLLYDFMPITRTKTECVTIQSAKDAVEKLDILGESSVSFKGISDSD